MGFAAAPDDVPARCRELLDAILEPARAAARELGYAIGVHGSLARDVDLMAMPWTLNAAHPARVAEAIRKVIIEHGPTGRIETPPWWVPKDVQAKPNGRMSWSFYLLPHVNDDDPRTPYVDLCVFPPIS